MNDDLNAEHFIKSLNQDFAQSAHELGLEQAVEKTRLRLQNATNNGMVFTVGEKQALELFFSVAEIGISHERNSLVDTLTGLYNRRYCEKRLEEELAHSLRVRNDGHDRPIALGFADIDKFKSVNDTYGHNVGDQALKKLAETLRDCARESDVICRYAGDEFVIIFLPDSDGVIDSSHIEQRYQQALDHIQITGEDGEVIDIKASLAVTTCDVTQGRAANMHMADQAMYEAKELRKRLAEINYPEP